MQNIEYTVEGSTLILKIALDAPTHPSKSGKTQIVATTGGNKTIHEADDLTIGVNAYFKR